MSPFYHAAGHGDQTEEKQELFGKLVSMLLTATKKMRRARTAYPPFVYFDFNAGPGIYDAGFEGSPIIALERARRFGELMEGYLYERDPETRDDVGGLADNLLKRHLNASVRSDHVGAASDAKRIAEAAEGRQIHGLLYCDPNPDRDLVPHEAIRAVFSHPAFWKLDCLVYVSATNYTRQRQYRERFLLDDLRKIGKRFIGLREPSGAFQWTFALLTNWPGCPSLPYYGFKWLGTPEGEALAVKLNLSARERNEQTQPDLFATP